MIRIGVDPGVRECGVAIEIDDYRIAFMVSSTAQKLVPRAVSMAAQIDARLPTPGADCPVALCVEGQQVYRAEKAKGDPNDMIKLATVAGIVLGVLGISMRPDETALPLPRQWKGSVPKDIHHARLARSYPQWVEPVAADTSKSLQHHVWDAVGLLEWHKERLKT